jgi:quinol-cytochrome oxidoreductase complex cytochrome b subunit
MFGFTILYSIFLAMHYTGHVDIAFESVEHIMRDIPFGWLLRYAHANGASLFFLAVYIHIFRGLYYVVIHLLETNYGLLVL